MTRAYSASVALVALIAIGTAAAKAQETTRVSVTPDSKLWIDGTSNLHSWTCNATSLEASIEVDPIAASKLDVAAPKALKRVQVQVPVKAIKCGHGGMDDNLYKALKADGSPNISYILATFEAVPGDEADTFTLHTAGTLSVAGVENKITMDVTATRLPDGSVRATGVVPIKMTDYGVQPPTAIFGRLKTGNEVKVNFELTVGARTIAEASLPTQQR